MHKSRYQCFIIASGKKWQSTVNFSSIIPLSSYVQISIWRNKKKNLFLHWVRFAFNSRLLCYSCALLNYDVHLHVSRINSIIAPTIHRPHCCVRLLRGLFGALNEVNTLRNADSRLLIFNNFFNFTFRTMVEIRDALLRILMSCRLIGSALSFVPICTAMLRIKSNRAISIFAFANNDDESATTTRDMTDSDRIHMNLDRPARTMSIQWGREEREHDVFFQMKFP